jgi:hypothetical protein
MSNTTYINTKYEIHKFDPAVNLCAGDISFFTDYVILRLKESKTDPFRKGIDIKQPCIRSTEFKIIISLGRRPPADVFF